MCASREVGRRIQQSLKTDNRKVAEKLYAKVLTDLIEGKCFETTVAKRVLFREMSEKCLEKHEHSPYRASLKPLSAFFNGRKGAGIEEDAILAAGGEEERRKRRAERSEDCRFKRYVNNLMPKAKSRRRVGKCFLEKIVRTVTDPQG